MNNFILGSGLIGRIASDINPSFIVAPFGKSRFYSYNPPLAENYISSSQLTTNYINKYTNNAGVLYKRSFSIAGEILSNPSDDILDVYTHKVYDCSSVLMKILLKKNVFFVYDMKPNELYVRLKKDYNNIIISKIDCYNHVITTSNGSVDYDKIISTIPLNVLYNLIGINNELRSKCVYVYDVMTNNLDFEGADELLVVDEHIDFYRVQNISKNRYIFYSLKELDDVYFSAFLKNYQICNSTAIPEYIPVGDIPKLELLNSGIECVGSMARWDDFYDIGASINKLMKI